MKQKPRQPVIIVEGQNSAVHHQAEALVARGADLSRLDRYLELFSIIAGFEALLIALIVGAALLPLDMWPHNILAPVGERNLALALAVSTVLSVGLFGVTAARNFRTLQYRTRQRNDADTALEQSESRLQLAQAAAGIATIDWDIAGNRAVWSANFFKVFGVRDISSEIRSPYEHLLDLIHPDDRGRMDAMHLALLKEGGTYADEFRIRRPDGETRWLAARGEVFCDARGIPRRLIGANFDITERRRTEEALRDSLNIVEFANDAGEIGVWNNDFVVKKTSCDDRTRNILNLGDISAPLNAAAFYVKVHPGDRERVRAKLAEAVKSGEKFALECRIQALDGKLRWVRIRGMAELDPVTRRAMRMTGIVFDITERRERELHLRFLMRELTHRSKNLLAVIQAMARQAGTVATSMEDFQRRFSARLQGLSASHDLLVDEDWHGAFMKDVISSQIGPFTDQIGRRILLEGPPLLLKPEAAQNIGMAVHELASNAAKYGALSNDSGQINVSWRLKPLEGTGARVQITWRESGGPPVHLPVQRGFGSVVMERVVARALEADVTISYEPKGLVWALNGPVGPILASAASTSLP